VLDFIQEKEAKMPKIDVNEAKKLAKLSRLEFNEDELANFVKEFDKTLEYMDTIQKVNTSNIDLHEKTINAKTQLREDTVKDSFTQDAIIANAPQSEDGAFAVPITVEEGE